MKKISIVVPVFNEEGNIELLAQTLLNVVSQLNYSFEVIFVDDGSSDSTLSIAKLLSNQNDIFHYVELARNYGHQNAIKAGIDIANGDCVITMDGDMQHPPSLIPEMIDKWEEGYDIVYTKRIETEGASFFKRITSNAFYKLMNAISEVKIEKGAADFRLLDNEICEMIRETKESELFLRAITQLTGYKQYAIEYKAAERNAGKSSYTFSKMFKFALQGITAHSVKPLHLATYLGLIFACGSILYMPYILYSYFDGNAVSGWSSLIATIVFFGGLQLFVLGIIGIYIGKIFTQVKQRPHYRIKETNVYAKNSAVKL